VYATLRTGEKIVLNGEALRFAARALDAKAPAQRRIRRGAIIRVQREGKIWQIGQLPEVEAAFLSLDPQNGAVRALVGGFDFGRNKFNHVTQAWRQPGSSFKPFIYSAALEKGFTTATVISDEPVVLEAEETGSQRWEPKNYDDRFEGPMRLRTALSKSKNMVSIRILDAIGPKYAREYVTRFGFEAEKYRHKNMNPGLEELAQVKTLDAIGTWEPRVSAATAEVERLQDQQKLRIRIQWHVRSRNHPGNNVLLDPVTQEVLA